MENTKQSWQEYKERLISYGYTEEELQEVYNIRENYEHCTFEMYMGLVEQGIVIRTRKLKKKKRNMFVSPEGKFYFLNHYHHRYEYAGYFKEE